MKISKNIKKPILSPGDFGILSSPWCSLFLLILLILACLVGALVPQNQEFAVYTKMYGAKTAAFFTVLHFSALFSSLWFQALLVLFFFNILFCSLERLAIVFKRIKPFDPTLIEFEKLNSFTEKTELIPAGTDDNTIGIWRNFLLLNLARPMGVLKEKTRSWGKVYYLEKGRWAHLGPYIIHLSLLLFLFAALLGKVLGFTAFVQLEPGKAVMQVQGRSPVGQILLPFEIKLEHFYLDLHESGAVNEYRSEVKIRQGDKDWQEFEIKVNHPLKYQGITFYQSTYGQLPGKVNFIAKQADKVLKANLSLHEAWQLDENTVLHLLDFNPSFQQMGAAALFRLEKKGQADREIWAFNQPAKFYSLADFGLTWDLKVESFSNEYWSGLQVVKDPGIYLIWLASLIAMLGLALTYFTYHRRLVLLEIEGEYPRFILLARSWKNKKKMETIFNDLVLEVNKIIT